MPVMQALIFLSIAAQSSRGSPPGGQELAASIGVTESRISRNVTLLEEAGLVERRRDPLNPRAKPVFVTSEGYAFLERITALVTRH